jgi:hypothetical protein
MHWMGGGRKRLQVQGERAHGRRLAFRADIVGGGTTPVLQAGASRQVSAQAPLAGAALVAANAAASARFGGAVVAANAADAAVDNAAAPLSSRSVPQAELDAILLGAAMGAPPPPQSTSAPAEAAPPKPLASGRGRTSNDLRALRTDVQQPAQLPTPPPSGVAAAPEASAAAARRERMAVEFLGASRRRVLRPRPTTQQQQQRRRRH